MAHLIRNRTTIALVALSAIIGIFTKAATPANASSVANIRAKAVGYIVSKQSPDGAFFDPAYPAHQVAETILALVASGGEPGPIARALAYVATHGPAYSDQGGRVGLIILGLTSAGQDPRHFGGHDYAASLYARYNPVTGSYDDRNIYADSLGMLGATALDEPIPATAINYLRANQCPTDGGFSQAAGCLAKPDVDTTSMAMQALLAAGLSKDDATIVKARAFLLNARKADGGFGYDAGSKVNANSTGLALSAIAALGEDPQSPPWGMQGNSPIDALARLALPSGGIRWQDSDSKPNDPATVQGCLGLSGMSYGTVLAPGDFSDPSGAGQTSNSTRARSGMSAASKGQVSRTALASVITAERSAPEPLHADPPHRTTLSGTNQTTSDGSRFALIAFPVLSSMMILTALMVGRRER